MDDDVTGVGSRQRRVLLAAPRGFCAGVVRAIDAVRDALEEHGPPVYVRRQIVHNAHVVSDLEARGAVFVNEADEAPPGAVLVLSAHGVAPEVRRVATGRGLNVIDATCPLVTKVHRETKRFAADGHTIVLIGQRGHDEVVGTLGQAPHHVIVVSNAEEVERIEVPDERRVAWVSQTTLATEHVAVVVDRLRQRFPALVDPPREDICYAVSNRQAAVRRIAGTSDAVIIVGAPNSHNSATLVPVATAAGAPSAYRVDTASDLQEAWIDGATTVGVASGASVPEHLVQEVLGWLGSRGFSDVDEVVTTVENQLFSKASRHR